MDLVIEDVSEHVVQLLKLRAARNGRSLQDELLAIFDAAASEISEIRSTE